MAFVHGPMLKKTGVKSKELLHSTDWYPTLINLAGKKKREGAGGGGYEGLAFVRGSMLKRTGVKGKELLHSADRLLSHTNQPRK